MERPADGPAAPGPDGPGEPIPPRWTVTPTESPTFASADEEPERVELWATVGGVRPWGTALLLLSWCGLYAVLALRGEIGDGAALMRWGANVATPLGPDPSWRYLASTFLHAGIAHLFFNGLALALFGPAVERVFTRWRFWLLFAVGAGAASWASAAWRASRPDAGLSISVGASGAIFALGGALLAAAWRLRRRLPPSRARALAGALLPLVLQGLVAGMTRRGTDNAAHVAGLLAGFGLGLVLDLDRRLTARAGREFERAAGVVAAAALVASLITAVLSGLAPIP